MTKKRLMFIFLSFTLSISGVLLWVMGAASSVPAVKADSIKVKETWLDFTGRAYEINPDSYGNLWISDAGAKQIWQVNPATSVYTIYSSLANPGDARMDSKGEVWWTDTSSTNLGRISLDANTVTTWTLPGTGTLWGITFDDQGNVWTTDFVDARVHRFTPSTDEVCTYPVPQDGLSDYIVAYGGDIWLADWWNNRIVKLDPSSNVFTLWQLTGAAYPQGLAMDERGILWWADEDLQMLGRLEPDSNRMTVYSLPAGTTPEMTALSGGKVWYTESVSGTVGVLDPSRASAASFTLVKTTALVTPACTHLGPGSTSSITFSSRTLEEVPAVYTSTVNSDGWVVYQLPSGASPWGIAAHNNEVWVIDQGRRKLVRLVREANSIYLPLMRIHTGP